MNRTFLVAALLSATALTANAAGPSFDCSKARQQLAQTICAHPGLSAADVSFAKAYQDLRIHLSPEGRAKLAAEDRAFLAGVEKDCLNTDGYIMCIGARYIGKATEWQMRAEWEVEKATSTESSSGSAITSRALIRDSGGGVMLPIGIDGKTVNFLIDTGASITAVPQDTARWLIDNGATIEGSVEVTLANGKSETRPLIKIGSVTIAGHKIEDVKVIVNPIGSDPLLGMNVLSRLPTWRIDFASPALIFETATK